MYMFVVLAFAVICGFRHTQHILLVRGVRVQSSSKMETDAQSRVVTLLPRLSLFEVPPPQLVAEIIRFDRTGSGGLPPSWEKEL